MTTLSASIIIPVWNGRPYLEACLRAALAQDYAGFEVIVVDNASGDGSAEFVAQTFPDVRLHRNVWNLGFAGGCNTGLKAAQGELLVLLNQDTEVAPNWLRALNDALQKKEVGVAGCKIFYPGGQTLQHAGVWLEWPLGLAHHHGQGEPDSDQWNTPRPVESVTGAAMAFRREVLNRVGPLDETFWPGYFEDIDFCLRAKAAGYEVWYAPQAELTHQESTSISDKFQRSAMYERGRLRFVLKHTPPARFLSEFVPAEEAYQLPAILGDGSHALRIAYLRAIIQAPAILSDCWQAERDLIRAVIASLQRLHDLAWRNDWRKVEQAVTGLPPEAAPDDRLSEELLPALHDIVFESDAPLLGPLIARFRALWYSVAAKWGVNHLLAQQEIINRQFRRRQDGYIWALERRVLDLSEANAHLAQELADLSLRIHERIEGQNE